MAAIRRLFLRLLNALRPGRAEDDLARELSSHLGVLEDEFLRRGMPADEARRRARLALGGVEQAKELHRDARSFVWLDDARRDVGYAVRMLRRNPIVAATVVLSIAIGIGANTAVFTVANALLFRAPTGVLEADRLVDIGVSRPDGGFNPGSFPAYLEIRRRATTLDGVFARQMFPHALSLGRMGDPTAPERVFAESVTTNYFTVLGARPAVGRLFGPADAEALGASPVVVLSHRYWRDRLNSDATVLGRAVRLNGHPFTVIGVTPEGFQGTGVLAPDIWVPLEHDPDPERQQRLAVHERWRVARDGGAAETRRVDRRGGRRNRCDRPGTHCWPSGWHEFQGTSTAAVGVGAWEPPGRRGVRHDAHGHRVAGAAGRMRKRLRNSPGARDGQEARDCGASVHGRWPGPAGAAVADRNGADVSSWRRRGAALGTRPHDAARELAAGAAVPHRGVARARHPRGGVHHGALAHCGAGVRPCAGLADVKSQSSGRAQGRLPGAVGAFVASARLRGLSGRLQRRAGRRGGPVRARARAFRALDPGFDPRGVELTTLDLSLAGYTDTTAPLFWRELGERARALPGVQDATLARVVPGGFEGIGLGIGPPGVPADEAFEPGGNIVEPGYFATLRIPMAAGRDFTSADRAGSQPVAIVGEAAAQHFWPGQNPIGRSLSQTVEGKAVTLLVVGVARDVRSTSLIDGIAPSFVYVPLAQQREAAWTSTMTLVTRSRLGEERRQRHSDARRVDGPEPSRRDVQDPGGVHGAWPGAPACGGLDLGRPRRGGAAAGGHRHLRGDGVCGEPPHARVRHPDRARRSTPRRASYRLAAGPGACRRGLRDRFAAGRGRRSGAHEFPARPFTAGPGDVCRRGGVVRDGRAGERATAPPAER